MRHLTQVTRYRLIQLDCPDGFRAKAMAHVEACPKCRSLLTADLISEREDIERHAEALRATQERAVNSLENLAGDERARRLQEVQERGQELKRLREWAELVDGMLRAGGGE